MNNLVILLIIIVALASLSNNVNTIQENTHFLFPRYRDSYLYNRNMENFIENTEDDEEKKEEESQTMKNVKGYTRGLLIAAGAREKTSEEVNLEKKIKEEEKIYKRAKEKAEYANEIKQKTNQSAEKI